MTDLDNRWAIFMDIHSGLPRQGPGDDGSTARALALCKDLPTQPHILDVGCGPGMQTLALARHTAGPITAIDRFRQFLVELVAKAAAVGLSDRISTQQADMAALPFGPNAFDLIWSEGAIYIMGIVEALTAWRPLLRPGGYLAFSEAVWLKSNAPQAVSDFWQAEYPQLTTAEGVRAKVQAAAYHVVGNFTLPARAWWDQYYTPLEAKLPALKAKYADDDGASEILAATRHEIDICRQYGDWYGYEFFIAQKP